MHPYIEYMNPYLGARLEQIGLNKQFVRGEGCHLYDHHGQKYLDLIAAYGALPFGFNHPEIWQAIMELKESMEPSFVQPSFLDAASSLAEALVKAAPGELQYATFANSGAEAVEAAIKLCRSCTGRSKIVSTNNSFHGKTLGALSATGNPGYQKAFGAPVEGFCHVPFGDIQALQTFLDQEGSQVAGFFVEPIQGEGGIIEAPQGYLAQVKSLCQSYGVLTVFDEIQTGLGRTGSIFACEQEEVAPDILLLAKALGGGMVPIGAVLCTAQVYTEDFGLKHSSTFAGNSIGARVGLQVLDLLQRHDGRLLQDIRRKGKRLKRGLEAIQQQYPGIIQRIRGRGFMLGIEFGNRSELYPDSLLGVIAEQEILTPLIASYLLNVEKIRVAPTLNGASVIRIEPPLIISDQEIDQGLLAIGRAVGQLAQGNTASFLGHLVGYKSPLQHTPQARKKKEETAPPKTREPRFAFLVHPISLESYTDFDASLADFSSEQLLDLSTRWNDLVEPFVVSKIRVTSQTGKSAYGEFIVVPRTAKQLQAMGSAEAAEEIGKAVELAGDRGADIVGLGAYTSVVTVGGRAVASKASVPITTGNSFTVISGVDALVIGAKRLGISPPAAVAAVVGATGAVGKASAVLLAEDVKQLILLGNPKNREKSEFRMLKVAGEIFRHIARQETNGKSFAAGTVADYVLSLDLPQADASFSVWKDLAKHQIEHDPTCPLRVSVDANAMLPTADMVLAATSSVEALITPDMLKHGAVVCDISRPANVSKAVLHKRPDVLIIDGGLIKVPGEPDLGLNFGFGRGLAYACMSETMMLALAEQYENTSIGADLNLTTISRIRQLAKEHGFTLAGFRRFDRPMSSKAWDALLKARGDAVRAR